jgi:hypothetical protein
LQKRHLMRASGSIRLAKFLPCATTPKINRCCEHLSPNGVVMSKNWMILTCMLFLGCVGISQAHPLDSPDTVYIDGLPCNTACQSYMAWSRRQTSLMAAPPAPTRATRRSWHTTVHRAAGENSKLVAPARSAKQAVPLPPEKIAELQPAGNAAVASEPVRANVAASLPIGGAAVNADARMMQERVAAATALAERVTAATAAPMPQQDANDAEASGRPETASVPRDSADHLVALLMARPEIKSVSDLAGKDVAMEERQSASRETVRNAITAAGAAEVRLSAGHTKAIDRLIGGEVPAAVLTLVSSEAAGWFPDVAGFRIFRIPLSPRS